MTQMTTPGLLIQPLRRTGKRFMNRPAGDGPVYAFFLCGSRAEAEKVPPGCLTPGTHSFAMEERETGWLVGAFSLKRDGGRGLSAFPLLPIPPAGTKDMLGRLLRICGRAPGSGWAGALSVCVMEWNTGSRRVLEKGFGMEGTLRFKALSRALPVYRLCLA